MAAASSSDEASALRLTEEMELFLKKRIRVRLDERETVQLLMDAILGPRGLALEYADNRTKSAAETFESRSGNCLSFTLLFVAMARQLGLNAHFNEVMEVMGWDRRGSVVWNSRHMIAEVSTPPGYVLVDFLPEAEKRYRDVRRISDERTLAHYYNNLGAEALAGGGVETALDYFGKALEQDPSFTPAWVNRGAAYRRRGDDALSEASYRKALEIDPSDVTAASNLVGLLHSTGRGVEAQAYAETVRRFRWRNPFYHFSRGLVAARADDLAAAKVHFKRAVRRRRSDPAFHAELAEVLIGLGEPRRACRSLRKAIKHTEDLEGVRRLELRLGEPGCLERRQSRD
jgi:Tfp pilus assembly protein PilF